MPRRGVGISRGIRKAKAKAAYEDKGRELTSAQTEHVGKQLETFKSQLERFAAKHKKAINKDPEFRRQFQTMCAKIGVDPLSSSKGFWAEILGVGDFYFELGVQIVHVCLAARSANGGIMDLSKLVAYLQRVRSSSHKSSKSNQKIETDDVKRAVKKLEVLGNGIRLMQVGPRKVVVSVPTELSQDHTSVMQLAQATGHVTAEEIVSKRRWDGDRVKRALAMLQREGMVWVDEQSPVPNYWFPAYSNLSF